MPSVSYTHLICVKILLTARISSDPLGCYICVGVFGMFMFQSIINIGMVLGVLPVIGITPVSYTHLDVYKRQVYYKTYLIDRVLEQMQQNVKSGQATYFEPHQNNAIEAFRTENYYLTPKGLVTYYQQYDIAPVSYTHLHNGQMIDMDTYIKNI